jgi:hypothetical protein
MACSLWNVPFLPVKPWTITLVFLSTNTAGSEANPRAPLCGREARAWGTRGRGGQRERARRRGRAMVFLF